MTERQFQTIRWAVILACLATFAFMALGCGGQHNPFSPEEKGIDSVVRSVCYNMGVGDINLKFVEEDRNLDPALYSRTDPVMACMAAEVQTMTVYVYPACQDMPLFDPAVYEHAAHECCHLKLGHVTHLDINLNIQNEVEANQCADEYLNSR